MQALKDGDKVALSIDSTTFPFKVLLMRGSVRIDTVDGIAPEYVAMCRRMLGEEAGKAWVDQLGPICPQMARIFVRPEWAGILDFEVRFPSALELAMERAQAGA